MNNLSQISVIIPVYNTETYLDSCIASVTGQSYKNLQIILVDDGSTDGSGDICDHWAAQDSRITVIHQKNSGVSAARNAALDAAQGTLISFVDSDDILLPNAYEELLKAMSGCDLVMGRMCLVEENGDFRQDSTAVLPMHLDRDGFLMELFQERSGYYLGFLWDKLLCREIIERRRIRFDPKIRLNEDRLFLLEYLLGCNTIVFCNMEIYGYRQHSSGVITATRRNRTVTDSEMTVIDSFEAMACLAGKHSDALYHAVCRKAFESCLDLISRTAKEDRQKCHRIRSFMRKNAGICISSIVASPIERIKIFAHCLLER